MEITAVSTFILLIILNFPQHYSADVFCGKLQVDVTVSPLVLNGKTRYLDLSWFNANPEAGDWVGLYDFDPVLATGSPLFKVSVTKSSGWVTTNTILDDIMISEKFSFEPECLGPWVAYVKSDDSTILASNCFRTQPTWMGGLRDTISSLKLTDVFIPGSHDSGTYTKYNASESLIDKYSITQEEPFISQFIYGIRYIDLRVAYYPKDDPVWWVNHGVVKFRPLQDIFGDIKNFLSQTQEIIILDAHEFPEGFGNDLTVHKLLETYLREELGDITASKSLGWKATLGDVWDGGNRLILSYNQDELVRDSDFLWPGVRQEWGNVDTLVDLYDYLEKVNSDHPSDNAWSAMAELTPSATDILLDRMGGLRNMANMVNHNVTEWYQGDWGKNVNIVSLDFFKNSAIIDRAILWNLRKANGDTSCK